MDNGGDLGPGPRPVQSQPCRFCSTSFGSEIELILHFHQEHFIPQKKKRRGLSSTSLAVAESTEVDDDEEDISNEFESDLESDSNQENESQEDEDQPMTLSSDFLTECEELLLQNPVLDPNSTEDKESETEPEEDDVGDFWKDIFPVENSDLSGTGTKTEVPVESSFGACDKGQGRQKRTLGLLRLLRTPDKKSPRPNLGSRPSRSPDKPLKERMRRITKSSRFECLFCGQSFKNNLLCSHIRAHIQEKPYVCKVCGFCFANRGNLTNHMRTHKFEGKFKCVYCAMEFESKADLTNHAICPAEAKPRRCDICGKRYIRKNSLQDHMKRFHNLVDSTLLLDNFKCSICRKEFKFNYLRLKHMASHTKEKRFECAYCKKRFAYNHNKNAHMKTAHGGRS